MTELVALRPKLYTSKTLGGSGDKKCKGVKKCCLLAGQNAFRKQPLFWNKVHEIHVIEENKLALSRDDDKQVVQSDGMSTLAYGYKEASTLGCL